MRRYARWIALLAALALAVPILATGIGAALAMEPLHVAAILIAVTVFALTWAAISNKAKGDEEG